MGAFLIVVALVGCADTSGEQERPAATPQATPAPIEVTGLITEISPDEGEPRSFVVEADDGDEYPILIDPAFDYGFNLNHLREHEELRDPVVVELRAEEEDLYATAILDAP